MQKAISLFEAAGFRVVHAAQDDFYMLVPNSKAEQADFGVPVLSPRAMQALDNALSARSA